MAITTRLAKLTAGAMIDDSAIGLILFPTLLPSIHYFRGQMKPIKRTGPAYPFPVLQAKVAQEGSST